MAAKIPQTVDLGKPVHLTYTNLVMDRIKIDLLRAKYDLGTPKDRGVLLFTRLFLCLVVITSLAGLVFSWGSANTQGGTVGFLSSIARLVGSGDRLLKGEENDRINILFLGVGGAGHEGAELADTLIFSSFRPSTEQVGMLSIPRDTLVPIPGYDSWRKINSVNAYGEAEKKGHGPELASQVIGDILDQPIDYYLKVDFTGFAQFIDKLGGLNIYVDHAFQDYEYPILGMEEADCGTTTEVTAEDGTVTTVPTYACRFEILSFQEGWMQMDGATALKYARSRKGTNGEGNDFARAARQQKILRAVKDKLLSGSTIFNPLRLTGLLETVSSHVSTNISPWELLRMASFLPSLNDETITHRVLDESGPLFAQTINGAYVLLPENNDWGSVATIAANIFNNDLSNVAVDQPTDGAPLFVTVEVQNGTEVAGLAFETSQLLTKQGFNVQTVGNAPTRDYEHTVIYDLTNGRKPDQLSLLANLLAADVSMSAAGWIYTNQIIPTDLSVSSDVSSTDDVDFLIVLGKNTENLVLR